MHIADGVLSLPVVVATSAITAKLVVQSLKGISEEEIPRISLMTGAFFALSLISIPIGPASAHPLLGGLLGVLLGKRAPLAFFVGLVIQALLFQHGGLTTLGANTMNLAIPALLVHSIFCLMKGRALFMRGAIAGALAIIGTLLLLIITLLLTDLRFGEGFFSVVNLLIISHLPLIAIEGLITGSALKLIHGVRPDLFGTNLSNSISPGDS